MFGAMKTKFTMSMMLLLLSCTTTSVLGFASRSVPSFLNKGFTCETRIAESSRLQMGFLDDVGKFFNDMSGGGESENNENDDDYDDEASVPTTQILSIPVESMKQGGLRLYLTFYLMGMQNTPEKGSWRTSQPDENYSIELYYQDMTGALAIRLLENEFRLERLGSTPSNKYLMQESVIVQGILDELDTCLSEGDAKATDRLIQLQTPNALEKARDSVSFG